MQEQTLCNYKEVFRFSFFWSRKNILNITMEIVRDDNHQATVTWLTPKEKDIQVLTSSIAAIQAPEYHFLALPECHFSH